jgi:zinc protease
MKIRIHLLAAVSAFAVVLPAYGQQASPVGPNRQHGVWAQDYTGRTADPQVRFGRLANGLRYAIRHNDTPKNAVSVRMLIGAGSLSERDEERGLAHYLEHMAFRGSANVRDGETVRMLERLGLRFGADTNAGTSFDHTVYQFDFPNADVTSLTTGLMLFREIGGRLKIDEATVDAERGVILSEERLRASGALKALEAQTALTLAGTKVSERFPIGTIDTIKAVTSVRIRRFYEANYRPENTTIAVVGAVDPVAVEAQLKATFADWRGAGPADSHVASSPNVGAVTAKTYVGPGAIDQLSVTWTRPLDTRADTEAKEKDQIARILALTVLNLRLRERSQAPGAPFSVASAHANESFGVAEQTIIAAVPAPGKWREAAAAIVDEQRRLARDGISAPDVTRVVALTRPSFKAAADAAATRTDAVIVDGLVESAQDDSVYTSPGQDLESFDKSAAAATPASLTEACRRAFTGVGPLAFRSSTDSTSGDDAALTAVVRQAFAAPLAASVATANVAWPYAGFGAPGRVIERSVADGSGITIVKFANGTRLAVKPTTFVAGGASVRVSFGEGIVGMRPEHPGSQWLLAFGAPAWLQGGTKKLSWTQMQRALEGHNVSASLTMRDTDFLMSGETRKAELPFQLQLLAAYYTDAAYRPDAVERVKGLIGAQLAAINSNTLTVMSRALGPITHNGDTRWKSIPNDDDVAAATVADLQTLLKKATAMPADVVVVGDVGVDDVIASVAGTFGALPAAPIPRALLYKARVVPIPPSGAPIVVTHSGRVDQAVNVQLWPTTDYYSAPTDSYALEVARALLSDRLVDTVREKLGLTYSPFASSVSDVDLPGNGYFLAGIEVPPEKFSQFQQLLNDELRALVASPITDDAIARAKRPIVSARLKARETNPYWDSRVLRSLSDPRSPPYFRDEISGIEQITALDVKRVLQRYIVGRKPLSIEVTAKNRP